MENTRKSGLSNFAWPQNSDLLQFVCLTIGGFRIGGVFSHPKISQFQELTVFGDISFQNVKFHLGSNWWNLFLYHMYEVNTKPNRLNQNLWQYWFVYILLTENNALMKNSFSPFLWSQRKMSESHVDPIDWVFFR